MGMNRHVRRKLAKGADPLSITFIEHRRDRRKVKGKFREAHQVYPAGMINLLAGNGNGNECPDIMRVTRPAGTDGQSRHR